MNVAQHAVKPRCPRCEKHVRSSVELKAALVDLRVEMQVLLATAQERSSVSQEARFEELSLRLHAVQAELAGEHLACSLFH